MKIALLGFSGAGKSTSAKLLAEHYKCPLLYLDKIQFLANWVERDTEEGRAMVHFFQKENEAWVIDGNYPKFCQAERLEQADQILFFSFNRFTCFRRALRRNHQYAGRTRESITDGCNEKIDLEFAWWILHKGRNRKRKRYYSAIQKAYPEKFIVFRNQKQVDAYLRKIGIAPITKG